MTDVIVAICLPLIGFFLVATQVLLGLRIKAVEKTLAMITQLARVSAEEVTARHGLIIKHEKGNVIRIKSRARREYPQGDDSA